MRLPIIALLAEYELAEEDLRTHPSAPARSHFASEAEWTAASEAWRQDYQRRHQALTAKREEVFAVVREAMRRIADPYPELAYTPPATMVEDDYSVSLRTATYFNSWMNLRADKRWGDSINAPTLAVKLAVEVTPL